MTLSLAIALFLAATLGADAALQAKSEKKAKADKFVQTVAISGECIKLVHAGHPVDGCKNIRACRKLWRRAQDRLRRPQFHTLLTSGRPKQIASSRFCSHTVQRPAKPKPLRSHSMASKPWIVRRAVWKDCKQPTRGMGRLTRKWSLSIPCCRCLVT